MTEPKKYAISRKEVTEIIIGLLDDKIETKEAIDKICSLAIEDKIFDEFKEQNARYLGMVNNSIKEDQRIKQNILRVLKKYDAHYVRPLAGLFYDETIPSKEITHELILDEIINEEGHSKNSVEDKSEVVAEGEVTYDEDEGDFWIGGTGNFYTIKDDIGEKLIKLVGKKVRIKVEVTDD
jgi:hypothetical protein